MKQTLEELSSLFKEAQKLNEFEFVMTLINYKSIGNPEVQANLHEWFDALTSYIESYNMLSGKQKTRMAALLYSTFFENSDFYNILGNLTRIQLGGRATSYLYWKTKRYERLLGIGEKEDFLTERLSDIGKFSIISFFKENHYREIRNTFFHSAYSLYDDEYILHDSDPIVISGIGRFAFSISEFFYPLVNNVIAFFEHFRDLYLNYFASYKEDKYIGICPLGRDAVILGSPSGLAGIRIPKAVQFYGEWHDSGIWFDQRFKTFGAHNLNISFPEIEDIDINESLSFYESKSSVRKDDIAFINLMDKISERNNADQIYRATVLLVKMGDTKYREMHEESNVYKKKSLLKGVPHFYKSALEMGEKYLDLKAVKGRIAELEDLISKEG